MTEELYAIRLGSAVMLAPSSHPAEAALSEEQINDMAQEVTRLVRVSPIVAAEPEAPLGAAGDTWDIPTPAGEGEWERRRAIQFADQIYFKARWPRKNQDLLWQPYAGPVIEDFMILYDGLVYAVAGRCPGPLPPEYSFTFGREGRRVIEAVLAASTMFQMGGLVGPTPMFPAIYVCFSDDPEAYSFGRDLVREGNTLESLDVFPRSAVRDTEAAVRNVLHVLMDPASRHYEAVLQTHEFFEEQDAVHRAFESASVCFRELARPSPCRPGPWIRRLARRREIREALGECYVRYANLEEDRRAAARLVEYATEAFSGSRFLRPHRDYTSTVLGPGLEWRADHIMEAARFLAEECRGWRLETATLQGAALGGLMVLAATALVLWLGS